MNILVYEDDENDLSNILECISSFFTKKDIDYSIDIFDLFEQFAHKIKYYDIFFIDIEVHNECGIDIGIKIRNLNKDAKLIFVTNYSKYLIDGYKANANRYFLKPLRQEEFDIEMNSVIKDYINEYSGFYDKKICDDKIYYRDILYIDYYNRKTRIHFISGKIISTPKPLIYWINQLNDFCFAQPYRSFLINLKRISGFTKEDIILENEERIPVSRLYRKSFEKQYLESITRMI